MSPTPIRLSPIRSNRVLWSLAGLAGALMILAVAGVVLQASVSAAAGALRVVGGVL